MKRNFALIALLVLGGCREESITKSQRADLCGSFQKTLWNDKETTELMLREQDQVDRIFEGRISTTEARQAGKAVLENNAKAQADLDVTCRGRGAGGMSIDAQTARSVLLDVRAVWLEEALAALTGGSNAQ